MQVYRLTHDVSTSMGTRRAGDLFYKEGDEGADDVIFYGFKGGYPIVVRSMPEIIMYMELAFTTDKPKDYFTHKKYSQYEVDQMMKAENKAY